MTQQVQIGAVRWLQDLTQGPTDWELAMRSYAEANSVSTINCPHRGTSYLISGIVHVGAGRSVLCELRPAVTCWRCSG